MLPYSDSKFTKIALGIFFLIIIIYGIYEARGLLWGPTIYISSEMTTVHEPYVNIEGRAERIASLSMNGKAVAVTEDGSFSEPYLLSKGVNHIALEAKDKYGHETSRIVEIVYVPQSGT